jgi:hypothetical protein
MHKYKLAYLSYTFSFNEIVELGAFGSLVYGGAHDEYSTLEESQLLI